MYNNRLMYNIVAGFFYHDDGIYVIMLKNYQKDGSYA